LQESFPELACLHSSAGDVEFVFAFGEVVSGDIVVSKLI
jgi:hypothetical protein